MDLNQRVCGGRFTYGMLHYCVSWKYSSKCKCSEPRYTFLGFVLLELWQWAGALSVRPSLLDSLDMISSTSQLPCTLSRYVRLTYPRAHIQVFDKRLVGSKVTAKCGPTHIGIQSEGVANVTQVLEPGVNSLQSLVPEVSMSFQ